MRPRCPRYSLSDVGSVDTKKSGMNFSSSMRYFQHIPSQSSSMIVNENQTLYSPE